MYHTLYSTLLRQAQTKAATIDDHADVPENDEGALLSAVANQPVTVAIEASGDDFRFYSGVRTNDTYDNVGKKTK